MTKISEYFTREEMECKCGCGLMNMTEEIMIKADLLRKFMSRPLIPNSGSRCHAHNKAENGHKFSWHLQGKAIDFSWVGFTAEEKYKMTYDAMNLFDGIGIAKSYLHVDLGGQKKLWVY